MGNHRSPHRSVIYGHNPVREAFHGRRRVYRVWLVEGPAGRQLAEDLEEWAADGTRPLPPASLLTPRELSALSGSPDHQGIVAEVEAYSYAGEEEVLQGYDLALVLDRVQDPQNLGAIIRTAEGAGAAVVIPRHRAAQVTPAVVKAAAGATEHAAVARVRNLTDFILRAQEGGFWAYGAAADAETSYEGLDYRGRTLFVLGSEGTGLGPKVLSVCDQLVSIPLVGRVSSLNVSVTAGVLLFEAGRQRRYARSEKPGGSQAEEG